jgi:hypothetical protein
MPVAFTRDDAILTLSVSGVVTNEEIATAFTQALASSPGRSGMALLWDSRGSQTPISADDMAWRFDLVSSLGQRGLFQRVAWLLRPDQEQLRELALMEMGDALGAIEASAFADEAGAIAWLKR